LSVDPKSVHLEDWEGREAKGIKLIPRAGEILYRLKTATQQLSTHFVNVGHLSDVAAISGS